MIQIFLQHIQGLWRLLPLVSLNTVGNYRLSPMDSIAYQGTAPMLWLLVLHISALLFWCASLLYLPILIAGEPASGAGVRRAAHVDSLERVVYTRVATPAALAAIILGTLIFLPGYTIDAWLVAKLTLVSALVICHVFTGSLVLRAEQGRAVQPACTVVLLILCGLIGAIVWLVLAKPSQEALLRL